MTNTFECASSPKGKVEAQNPKMPKIRRTTAADINNALVTRFSLLFINPKQKSSNVINNCAPIIIHSLPGGMSGFNGINEVTKIPSAIRESNDPAYGRRFQLFTRVKMPIIPVIIPAKHKNPAIIAKPSFIKGQMKSSVRITKQTVVKTVKEEAFFHVCNNEK